MSFIEAREQAKKLIEPYRPDHPRIRILIGFEVEPAIWADCAHYESPEDALVEAEWQDKIERDKIERDKNEFRQVQILREAP